MRLVEEGREREAVSVEGRWQDDLITGLLDVIGARFMPRRLATATPQARRRDHLRVRVINGRCGLIEKVTQYSIAALADLS